LNDDLLNDFLLEAFPNPERKGCPDEKILRAFAEDRLPPGSPTLQHVASCSECYAEYRHYRQDWKEASTQSQDAESEKKRAPIFPAESQKPTVVSVSARRPKMYPWAIAAGLLVVLGGGIFMAKDHHAPAPATSQIATNTPPVTAKVDLFNAVTVRGGGSSDEPMPMEQVSLPSAIVNLNVTLPRFSESGAYGILVAKDRAGTDVVARGLGNAVQTDGRVSVMVTLDLRKTAPGMYFLATVRGSDNGTYYYPLKVN
jgi:hypothetical protein